MEVLANVYYAIIGYGIGNLSVKNSSKFDDNFVVYHDNLFNKHMIELNIFESFLVLNNVLTSKECEMSLSLNSTKIKNRIKVLMNVM